MVYTAETATPSELSAASEPPASFSSSPSVTRKKGAGKSSVSLALTGSGGSGVMTAGQMLLDAAAHAGFQGLMTRSLGPQIRGGEAAAFVRLSSAEVSCPGDGIDILIAFDWQSTGRFASEIALGPDSLVLRDPDLGEAPAMITGSGARVVDLPLKEIVGGIAGGRPNMVGLGALAGLIGLSREAVLAIVGRALKRKGPEALEASSAGIDAGYTASAGMPADFRLDPATAAGPRWNISGNEAVGLGALRGGVRFVAAYPISRRRRRSWNGWRRTSSIWAANWSRPRTSWRRSTWRSAARLAGFRA